MFYPMNQYKSYLKYCSNRRMSSKKGSKNRINEQKSRRVSNREESDPSCLN